jgi:DNA-cytosine methyltransferase
MVSQRRLRYISLFSGIGGFELAIHRMYPKAKCLWYSEVKPKAIVVYETHFPKHVNMGDIKTLRPKPAKVDLITGGFPCTDLSSLARLNNNNTGLQGERSGLFFKMLAVIRVMRPTHIIIENNRSMKGSLQDLITKELEKVMGKTVYKTYINAGEFGVQRRRRIYWSTFPINGTPEKSQIWDDVLEPVADVEIRTVSNEMVSFMNQHYKSRSVPHPVHTVVSAQNKPARWHLVINEKKPRRTMSRWQMGLHSDTMDTQLVHSYPVGNSRTILASSGNNNLCIDRRTGNESFMVRHFSPLEMERLFFFPDDWTKVLKFKTGRIDVLGNAVVVRVIEFILESLPGLRVEGRK